MLESCATFNDLLAMATTCKELYRVYSSRDGLTIWRIALKSKSLHAIDAALVAVCVTQVIKDAYKSDRLPHSEELFPLNRFDSTRCLPNLSEFKHVLALQCFAQSFEDVFKHRGAIRWPSFMQDVNRSGFGNGSGV